MPDSFLAEARPLIPIFILPENSFPVPVPGIDVELICLGFLLELLGDEAFRRRGELEPQAIALLLNAHSRLQMSNPVLFESWHLLGF